ncbi:hypothetical protein Micbo1qcDRAFT_215634 [Microdochium bolleyi]|uniref:Zn(2)-C6 fungal-type domain-containing protein n=1 Tax=Microdochium bolleyi TaxID=196109 RepID=A0A136IS17_9PEZI|nr:hypothetical protein Micbo1qcDRAFT_215634 [Microdochium bolleyi]
MSEREAESESTAPRKRIAVACSRCRKRKIRCSGDPGNGGACTNCKNASYEPCMFLRVHSTETQLKDNGYYSYNPDTARAYQSRTISPAGTMSSYGTDASTDLMNPYRQSAFAYGRGNYYSPAMAPWSASTTYPDDGVEYASYGSYQVVGQDTVPMVPSYSGYSSTRPMYVDQEVSSYKYGSLVHRPAAQDTSSFALSSMSASLPSTSDRVVPSDRALLPSAAEGSGGTRTASEYASKANTATSSATMSDGYTGDDYESPLGYTAVQANLPSTETIQRGMVQPDAVDSIYAVDSYSYQPASRASSRRESLSGCGTSIYPSDPHHASALASPYTLPPSSSTTSSAAGSTRGSAAVLPGRSGAHDSSNTNGGGSHSQLQSMYDTRAIGSGLRGTA